jgi:hypothetical protein
MTCGVALALTLTAASSIAQGTKTIPGQTDTASATVEAIERASRQITLKNDDGKYEVLYVPSTVTRFDALKVGDTVKITYYENIILRTHTPGTKPIDTTDLGATPAAGAKPGGTAAYQRTITATITAIDQKAPSVSFSGPNGWSYTSRVEDKKALAQVRVGDQVDITWTAATLVSIDGSK